jgi:hypothetical protein
MRANERDGLGGTTERRVHKRLQIRLPVECHKDDNGKRSLVRTITQNVSTGGMYLELDSTEFRAGDRLRVALTVPPAEGVSSYEGCATCIAEVLRTEAVAASGPGGVERVGVAARFLDRLRISY